MLREGRRSLPERIVGKELVPGRRRGIIIPEAAAPPPAAAAAAGIGIPPRSMETGGVSHVSRVLLDVTRCGGPPYGGESYPIVRHRVFVFFCVGSRLSFYYYTLLLLR